MGSGAGRFRKESPFSYLMPAPILSPPEGGMGVRPMGNQGKPWPETRVSGRFRTYIS